MRILSPSLPSNGLSRRDFLKLASLAGGALALVGCGQGRTAFTPVASDSASPVSPSETPSPPPLTETAFPSPLPSETPAPSPMSATEFLPPVDGSYAFYALPEPTLPAQVSLMQALRERRSRRAFRSDELSVPLIAALLWAGFGVNRPDGKRTAPSAYNVQDIDIYLTVAQGLFRYDAPAHRLIPILPDDLRPFTGTQGFIAAAPLTLVYVSDHRRMDASDEERLQWSWAHSGCIAQNVYLACAALGLAVVVRSTLDRTALAKRMNLNASQHITLAQTIGYPA
ncbi:MAG: nitroreductase family protein [Anaerolineales bacterium]|nr:nitroreductase family protein [Anaerolineales bacterium]MCX7609573.1 nitroreductase family protein [Anaerolineales bacterium]